MAEKGKAPIIIRKKIFNAGHGHHGGAWKVAYADFVTAMMAFFLVMWLMGADEATKASIAGYFKDPGSQTPISDNNANPQNGDKLNVFAQPATPGGRPMDMPAGRVNAAMASEAD